MWQELFRIPGLDIPVYGYGLMMVIGFLAAIEVAKKLGKKVGIDPDIFVNAALIALVAGVAGARLSHVLENLGDYTRADRSAWANFVDAINIRSGGLTFYGGFLLAFPTLVMYAIWKKVPVRTGMDVVAPCLMVGLGFGRIGCLANGCCYGAECSLPWAITFPYGSNAYVDGVEHGAIRPPAALMLELGDGSRRMLRKEELRDLNSIQAALAKQSEGEVRKMLAAGKGAANPIYIDTMVSHARAHPGVDFEELAAGERSESVHPAQIYSAITAFLLAGLLVAYFTVRRVPGRVFALMLMLEGVARFILEMLRVEPGVVRVAGHELSLSMVLGLGLAALGVVLWVVFGAMGREKGEGTVGGELAVAPA